MFRDLLRKKQQLSNEHCFKILKQEKRGFLSVLGDDDYPYVLPINYYFDEKDGAIYFHTGKCGHKLDSIKKHDKVSFCVVDGGHTKDGDWALNFNSVIVFGKIEIIENLQEIIDISYKLSRKFTDDEEYIKKEIQSFSHLTILLKLTPLHVCGKSVNES